MKNDIKVDGKGILKFLKSRKILLENRYNQIIIELQLLWFLILMLFFSGFIIVGLIISLFLGCKISITNSDRQYFFKKDIFK
ncbi:hypothetical protein E2R68_09475 [Psychromonas sp. RZ22]|uniref:hypothetical protein n=1 Tax=Psychromonas algarum TaxID=2555643 RepID=UPI001067786A|nr:hypothetical protein [Psychromonas sp. RZ22]TEW54099.1 hypothetical protein E2R68_09475 [Psychromonas sp. RZ22]